MNEIIPAIIPNDLNLIKERLEKILGVVKKVQIDVVDGEYTEVKTWPFANGQFEEIEAMVRGEEKFPYINEIVLEVDMFVRHPVEYLGNFISIGAKSFVIHIDSTDHLEECIKMVRYANCRIGLGIKPSSDISVLDQFITEIDFVQFMGNDRVGHSGVELDKEVLEKIKEFHKRHPSVEIQIDIGVNEETIPKLKSAGASSFVSGSSIFNSPDPKSEISKLQNI